jgi:hypothetical protein
MCNDATSVLVASIEIAPTAWPADDTVRFTEVARMPRRDRATHSGDCSAQWGYAARPRRRGHRNPEADSRYERRSPRDLPELRRRIATCWRSTRSPMRRYRSGSYGSRRSKGVVRAGAGPKDQPPRFMDCEMMANPWVAARRLPTTA